jgi:hypothetical protein
MLLRIKIVACAVNIIQHFSKHGKKALVNPVPVQSRHLGSDRANKKKQQGCRQNVTKSDKKSVFHFHTASVRASCQLILLSFINLTGRVAQFL